MDITICKNLKEYRKNKGNTQEDLAEHIGISIQAVSKWERNEGYPDITLLPKIAAYYNVSVDDLLGVGEIRKQERIQEYQKRAQEFAHIGDIKNELAVWRKAQKEFPNDYNVLCSLMYALSNTDEKENSKEIIEIGEKILAQCTDHNRYSAIQVLCFHYNMLGNKEKAKECAQMAPDLVITNTLLLGHVLEGDELIDRCQHNILSLAEELAQEIFVYSWYRGGIKDDEKKRAYHTALKIYELIYEDGDFGFYACRISQIYSHLAKIAAEQQNKTETLDYLGNAVKYAIVYDTQKDFKRTSLLVNRSEHCSGNSGKNYMSNDSYLRLKETEDKRYDFCRDDEQFKAITEKLQEYAK